MKAWIWIGLSVMGLCTGCSGDDSDGAGNGGAGGASGIGAGGSGGTGGSGGAGGSGGVSGASGTNGGGAGGAGGVGGVGGDIDVDPPAAGGQVVAPWDQYCVATFTEEFDVTDSFGDVVLTAQAGDRYLLGDSGFFAAATLVYIAAEGPVELDIEVEDESMLPFTTSCPGRTLSLVGVFADMPVFSDEALTMPLCTLQAGLTVNGAGIGYAVAGSDLFTAPYQVTLGALGEHCGGASEGFVASVDVPLGGGSFGGVPFATLLAPVM